MQILQQKICGKPAESAGKIRTGKTGKADKIDKMQKNYL